MVGTARCMPWISLTLFPVIKFVFRSGEVCSLGTRRSGSETRKSGTRIASWRWAAIQAAHMHARAHRRRSSAASRIQVSLAALCLQFYWVELISNSDWLKCLLLVNNNLVTKGGCLIAALAKSKTHTTFIIVILLMASRTIMESPEQRT